MEIRILAFGIAKDIFGGSSVGIELNNATGTSTVEELRTALEEKYPRLKQLASYMVAVNNEYAQQEHVIATKDEIAIIPPVSGG